MESTVAALNRKAWGLFLLTAVLAAAWMGVNLWIQKPAVGPVPLQLLFILFWNAVLLYGLWRALAGSDFPPANRAIAWLAAALTVAIWIAIDWTLAANGIFSQSVFGKVPAIPVAIILPLLIGIPLLTRWNAVAKLLDATPAHWLIGLQMYRILGATFVAFWIHGNMPGAFALPAGLGDVLTGLLALPAAVWVASGVPTGRGIGIRWNLFGIMDFVVAVTFGMLTSPGPAHLLALEHPNTRITTFPAAMIPAFVVPFSTLLHVLSLRQLRRLQTSANSARAEVIGVNRLAATGPVQV